MYLETGHRYADQVLPDHLNEEYFCWSVADRDPKTYQFFLDNYDILQLMEIYAMKRTDLYIDLEDEGPPPESQFE